MARLVGGHGGHRFQRDGPRSRWRAVTGPGSGAGATGTVHVEIRLHRGPRYRDENGVGAGNTADDHAPQYSPLPRRPCPAGLVASAELLGAVAPPSCIPAKTTAATRTVVTGRGRDLIGMWCAPNVGVQTESALPNQPRHQWLGHIHGHPTAVGVTIGGLKAAARSPSLPLASANSGPGSTSGPFTLRSQVLRPLLPCRATTRASFLTLGACACWLIRRRHRRRGQREIQRAARGPIWGPFLPAKSVILWVNTAPMPDFTGLTVRLLYFPPHGERGSGGRGQQVGARAQRITAIWGMPTLVSILVSKYRDRVQHPGATNGAGERADSGKCDTVSHSGVM